MRRPLLCNALTSTQQSYREYDKMRRNNYKCVGGKRKQAPRASCQSALQWSKDKRLSNLNNLRLFSILDTAVTSYKPAI